MKWVAPNAEKIPQKIPSFNAYVFRFLLFAIFWGVWLHGFRTLVHTFWIDSDAMKHRKCVWVKSLTEWHKSAPHTMHTATNYKHLWNAFHSHFQPIITFHFISELEFFIHRSHRLHMFGVGCSEMWACVCIRIRGGIKIDLLFALYMKNIRRHNKPLKALSLLCLAYAWQR